MLGCISFDSYIKPQHGIARMLIIHVVYLLIPTSNHNMPQIVVFRDMLYIFWFLHQTTTIKNKVNRNACCISFDSYIKPQHLNLVVFSLFVVYLLIPTSNHNRNIGNRSRRVVVYLLIPTSNHNTSLASCSTSQLYIFWFLHQTTTET